MSLRKIIEKFNAGEITKPEFIDQMHRVHAALFEYSDHLPRTDIARIEITDGQVVMTSRENAVKILCDRDDKRIAPVEILNFSHYEKADSDMIYRLVGGGDRVLDIGANVGWYSINLAKRHPSCRVMAFEPIPKTFSYLKRNVELNALTNVEIHNFGFSNKDEELSFFYYPSGSGNASAARLAEVEGVEKVQCRVRPLDDFMEETSAPVDFIKCDVEGAELFVFRGGRKTLERHRPIVFSEMLRKWSAKFNYHPNEIIGLFAGLGYRCYTARDGKLATFASMDEDTVETNFYFLHPEKHADKIGAFT